MVKARRKPMNDGSKIIKAVLDAAAPRPDPYAEKDEKIKYAIRFADTAAKMLARDLDPHFSGASASAKREAKAASGSKQLDVHYSTSQLGLAVGISLKSVHFRDAKKDKENRVSLGRYTHNMKRNEEELRIEASGYHKRQPYAVMVAVLFLPYHSCEDAKGKHPSSFGAWVRHLRPYSMRRGPHDDIDRFELIFVCLYEEDGSSMAFFDVATAPPKQGRPHQLLSYGEFINAVHKAYQDRNQADFCWADGRSEPLSPEELLFNAGEEDGDS